MKVAFILTHDCQLACPYCYAGEKAHRPMPRERLEQAVRFAFSESKNLVDLTFFGGEPLLEKELLRHGVEYAHRYKEETGATQTLRAFSTTNGLGADDEFLQWCLKWNVRLTLSLDGWGEWHDKTRHFHDGRGSFSLLEPRFPAFLSAFPEMNILLTVTPLNLDGLAEGVANLYGAGFRHFYAGPDFEIDWSEEDFGRLDRELGKLAEFWAEKLRSADPCWLDRVDARVAARIFPQCRARDCCGRGEGEIAIAPSGNLYPCLRFVKDDRDDSLRIGHLDTGVDRKKRAKIMLAAEKEPAECQECAAHGRCFHYCGALNFRASGNFGRPPASLCRAERIAIGHADRVAAELYEEKCAAFMNRYHFNQ